MLHRSHNMYSVRDDEQKGLWRPGRGGSAEKPYETVWDSGKMLTVFLKACVSPDLCSFVSQRDAFKFVNLFPVNTLMLFT